MYDTAEFRRGLKVEVDGEPYEIVDFQHVKMGRGGAFVRTRLRHLATGLVVERTFRSGERVARPELAERPMQLLYRQGEEYVFMDAETYEQLTIPRGQLGEACRFLKEGIEVTVWFHRGRVISVELPHTVELRVVRTDPGLRGDTASGGSKPAELETGAVVQVPLFVQEGDVVRVDTRSGQYLERA